MEARVSLIRQRDNLFACIRCGTGQKTRVFWFSVSLLDESEHKEVPCLETGKKEYNVPAWN